MNTIMKTRNVLAGILLASGGLLATGASAVPITEWEWESDGGFVIGGSTCDNGGEAACNLLYDNTGVTPSGLAGTASTMTWGTPSQSGNGEQSGLQGVFGSSGEGPHNAQALGSDDVWIGNGDDPALAFEKIITNGGWVNTGAAVHYNNIITVAGGNMETSILRTNFRLTTPGPGSPPVQTDLDIMFNETLNESPCPDGNPHGTTCDDIFTLSGTLSPITFFVDGQLYKASFRFANGPGAIVDGNTIYTAEESPGTAVVYVQGRIDTIPLPGVLALMGMGLMMIGWRVRRRKLV